METKSIYQLRQSAKAHLDEAMRRIEQDNDFMIYDSLKYHLTEFIEGLSEDLNK